MVCRRLPWNVLDFWLETFRAVCRLVLFEARRVPWFAGGYHGTFWIFGLKPSRLFVVWYCLRPVSRPMVCGRLPWNVLNFWHETLRAVSCLVLLEARHVPWFAGGYHGTFWIRKCLQNCGFLISMYYAWHE